MKTLIVVRHAKSSWANFGQTDFDRPLNERGITDAPKMAARLKEKAIFPQVFLSSPAKRAKQTCEAFCSVLGKPLDDINFIEDLYHAPSYTIYNTVASIENRITSAILFAHNPGITDFANSLCNELEIYNLPTCGMVAVNANTDDWAGFELSEKQLLLFDFPKNSI